MGLMEKIFGDLNEKEVKKIGKIVDQVEALDERNIQVELRARSRTLSLLRGTLMAVLILSLIGALANPEGELVYGGMMVVSGVLYTLSLFIELACSFYYEGRI